MLSLCNNVSFSSYYSLSLCSVFLKHCSSFYLCPTMSSFSSHYPFLLASSLTSATLPFLTLSFRKCLSFSNFHPLSYYIQSFLTPYHPFLLPNYPHSTLSFCNTVSFSNQHPFSLYSVSPNNLLSFPFKQLPSFSFTPLSSLLPSAPSLTSATNPSFHRGHSLSLSRAPPDNSEQRQFSRRVCPPAL